MASDYPLTHTHGTHSSHDTLQTSCDRKMSTLVNVQAVQAISTDLAGALLPLPQPTQQATQQLTQQLTQQPTQQPTQQLAQQPTQSAFHIYYRVAEPHSE